MSARAVERRAGRGLRRALGRGLVAGALGLGATVLPAEAGASPPAASSEPVLLTSGLAGGGGSTVGPGGALYVTEGAAGRVSRVDPRTGDVTTFASGLPLQLIPGLGGAMDVAFIGGTAYVLVTLVDDFLGGADTVGIYRVDGPDSFTVVADLGTFSIDNPPDTEYFIPSGVQYAIENYRGGFLVTDGHHNRVLRVTLDGGVTEIMTFGNIVPTGLAVSGNTILLAQAGPVPHLPQDGRVVSFQPGSSTVTEVAVGGRLLVDVERGRGRTLYALAQGVFPIGEADGSPALPDTGELLRVSEGGGFTVLTTGLDRPTSLELIGTTAYVVTLGGEIWVLDGVSEPPHKP